MTNFHGRGAQKAVTTPPVNFLSTAKLKAPPPPATQVMPAAAGFERAQQHPRIVENSGEQTYSGPKPTKKLTRGGQPV